MVTTYLSVSSSVDPGWIDQDASEKPPATLGLVQDLRLTR
jgi:hypothetical protein